MPKKIDYTGQKIGKLLVLEESTERLQNCPTWKCQCDCGNIKLATSKYLKTAKIASCGCANRKNIIGKKYGMLTVIDFTSENRHGSALWKCQCDCGNIAYATTEGLRVGDNVSCGCKNKAKEKFKEMMEVDLTGKTFGKLTVIEKTDLRNKQFHVLWKCLCDCGNITYVSTNHLNTGNTKSCGCLNSKSYGEIKISEILQEHKILFKSQYIFKDLPNRKYDFAIFNDCGQIVKLIEFDGEQHYIEQDFFKQNLQEQQAIDKIKTDFAESINIPLLRIPYWKRDNLKFEDLEIDINELSQR